MTIHIYVRASTKDQDAERALDSLREFANTIQDNVKEYVENEYEEGKPCYELYVGMHDAYERICHRLGKPDTEDRDVEIIINNLLDIGRHLSLKMYDYGYFFASNKV